MTLLRVVALLASLGLPWGFLKLVRLIDVLAGRLLRAGVAVDRDILTTAAATAIATLLAVAVTGVLSQRLRAAAYADRLGPVVK